MYMYIFDALPRQNEKEIGKTQQKQRMYKT
jgi:hypothetical protein